MDRDAKEINERIEVRSLPVDVEMNILHDKTSVGKNGAIPEVSGESYLDKILQDEYKDAIAIVNGLGDFRIEEISGLLAMMLKKCIEMERPYRNQLERICMDYVIEFFRIPEESVDINVSLNDKVSAAEAGIRMDPADGGEPDRIDVNGPSDIASEIAKRKFINALCVGAGMRLSMRFGSFRESINAINPKLMPLYERILALNYFLILTEGRITPTDDDDLQIGTVVLNIGNDRTKAMVEANAVIFPVLLSELITGLLELFVSHGLPKDREMTSYILRNTDYLKSEPWNMRMGPALWDRVEKSLNYVETNELPYLFKKLSELKYPKFNELMNEVLLGTGRGRKMMQSLVSMARHDMEYDDFVDRMDMRRSDMGVITDEYTNREGL